VDIETIDGLPPAKQTVICRRFETKNELSTWLEFARQNGCALAVETNADALKGDLGAALKSEKNILVCAKGPEAHRHSVGAVRALVQAMAEAGVNAPLWLRVTDEDLLEQNGGDEGVLMEASMQLGALLCDGLGDVVSVETQPNFEKSLALCYDILQGARLRTTKTEYISCPSCGRTLYDLQATTARIKEKTGHLKGVTIAIMGCIVNGPGEMADADFGYVGGAPGKINLYVNKDCKKVNIPMDEAVDRLIDLIKEHGKWVDPQ